MKPNKPLCGSGSIAGSSSITGTSHLGNAGCYLASGKPAFVQHTGPSRFLPAAEGLFRFRSLDEAVQALAAAEADYERHCSKARALAEEHFDAKKVVGSVLERALP